jgi:hypothetical protein
MLKNIHLWAPLFLINKIKNIPSKIFEGRKSKKTILFTICDHFEPYWNQPGGRTAYNRVKNWVENYQSIANKFKDRLGNNPKHCFFYPEEEYNKELLNMIKEICQNGFGETEVHLHHDNDNSENLRRNLIDYKNRLHQYHGLLPIDKTSNEIKYGFIHGNWALDNSRPDGKWCGVNDEISVLQETGCYADFTMPSAPSDTQTKITNSIYYALDDPNQPKSHDSGQLAIAGRQFSEGLLCIQGPLCFNIHSRKYGIIPRIENGAFSYDVPFDTSRISMWINQRIHVHGRPDIIFIKVYTHGAQDNNIKFFFREGALDLLFSSLEKICNKDSLCNLYYVSARQMYNVVKGLESLPNATPESLFDYELKLQY